MALVHVRATKEVECLLNPHQCDHGLGPVSSVRHSLVLTVGVYGYWVRCWDCDLSIRTRISKRKPKPDPDTFVSVGHFGYRDVYFGPWARPLRIGTVRQWG